MPNVEEKNREYSYLNVQFHLVIPTLKKGQSPALRLARDARRYFCRENYMILPDRIIVDKSLDMPVIAFIIDVEKNCAAILSYMKNSKTKAILSVEFYHEDDWRDINFSIVVEDGHVTHLVERGCQMKDIKKSALKAYKALTGG